MLKRKFELKWRNLVIVILQAHPWLTDSDWELLCRLMACQKLSLEASTHGAQNERLPLRFIVQGSLLRAAPAADICRRLLLCLLKLQLTDTPEQQHGAAGKVGMCTIFPSFGSHAQEKNMKGRSEKKLRKRMNEVGFRGLAMAKGQKCPRYGSY
ncbi:unnamed protein product [Lactuca virosa]|uniref:NPH3 domain-containing protein n=1 Tax=Lactuca virosa TaxID=75947 RepID=A0AAU9MD91_9ASTR|nr:unnamed protein product [Lactuca virosa]